MAQRLAEVWRQEAEDLLWSSAISADGGKVAFGSWEKRAYCFDRQGGPLLGHEGAGAVHVALSQDGSELVVGSYDKSVRLFDIDGKVRWSATFDNFVRDLAQTDAGVVVAEWQGPTHLIGPDGASRWRQKVGTAPLSLAASASGGLIVVGLQEGKAVALGADGAPRWEHTCGGGVTRVAVSADGSMVALGSTDTVVTVVDGASGTIHWRYKTGTSIRGLGLSAGGEYLLVASHEDYLYLFTRDGTLRWVTRIGSEVWSLAVSALADLIAIGTRDNRGYLFELKEVVLEQFDRLAVEVAALKEGGASVKPLEELLEKARSASTAGDREELGVRMASLRAQLQGVRESTYRDQAQTALHTIETLCKELDSKDTTLLELMATQARELLAAGAVERAARLLQRALSLKDNLPPLLEDLMPHGEEGAGGSKDAESDAAKGDGSPTVCDSCERPARAGWSTCPFCGAALVG